MGAVTEMSAVLSVAVICAAVGLARATYYRRLRPPAPRSTKRTPRRLDDEERAAVLAVLHQPRFADLAPAEVYASLLDEGSYLCSERTMYRVLAENSEVRERRNQLRHRERPLDRTPGSGLIPAGVRAVGRSDFSGLQVSVRWTAPPEAA